MNIIKRIISAITSIGLIISLTACASNSASSGSDSAKSPAANGNSSVELTGAWVEEEITIPSEIGSFNQLTLCADGTLVSFANTNTEDMMQMKTFKFASADNGKTWEQTPVEWDNVQNGVLFRVASSENGTLLYQSLVLGDAGEDSSYKFFLQKPGEEMQEYVFDNLTIPGNSNVTATFLDNSTLYIVLPTESSEKMHVFHNIDENRTIGYLNIDSRISGIPVQLGITPVYGEKQIYFPNYNLNSSTFEILKAGVGDDLTVVLDKVPSNKNIFSTSSDKNAFYFANKEGIFSIANGGAVCEEIVSAENMQLSLFGSQLLCRAADGSFISIPFGEKNPNENRFDYKLYRYYFDETKTAEPKSEALQIWSLHNSDTIRKAVLSLAEEGINAEYTVGMPAVDASLGPDDIMRDDVLRAFNSEMLAGGGPDIIVLDGLDYESYIQKGMLSDLSGLVDSTSLAPFISDAFYKTGEAYALPARFSVPVLFGDEGDVSGIKSLADLQKEILAGAPRADANGYDEEYYAPLAAENRFGISFLSVKQLCDFTLQASAPAIIQNGEADASACEEAYQFINGVAKHYNMKEYRPDSKQPRNGAAFDDIVLMDGGYEYSVTSRAKFGWDLMLNPGLTSITRVDNTTKARYNVDLIAQPGLCDGVYVPTTMLSINAQTQLKAQAEQFVKLVFKEGQAQFDSSGMSVMKSDFNTLLSSANEQAAEILSSLKVPVLTSPVLSQKFYENAQKMIDNGLSAADAAASFKKDIALYLAERQ